jgi:hypothetical protein
MHTDDEGPEEPPSTPEPDDPVRLPDWKTSATSGSLQNYGPKELTIKSVLAVSIQDGNISANLIPSYSNVIVMPYSRFESLKVIFPEGQKLGIIIFYDIS